MQMPGFGLATGFYDTVWRQFVRLPCGHDGFDEVELPCRFMPPPPGGFVAPAEEDWYCGQKCLECPTCSQPVDGIVWETGGVVLHSATPSMMSTHIGSTNA